MVNVHAPAPLVVAVPSVVAPLKTVMVLLASAVPVSVSVVSLVTRSLLDEPVSVLQEETTGEAGAMES